MLNRRMMMQMAAPGAAVPEGYVTEGLIFFLDGRQLADAGSWTDIVGGKTFTLTNCTAASNGVAFDGTAYGEYSGAVSEDWENETIEVVFSGYPVDGGKCLGLKAMSLLYQPTIDGKLGASFRFGDEGGNIRMVIAVDGERRALKQFPGTILPKCIGLSADIAVVSGRVWTSTSISSYSANTSGKTILGARTNTGEVSSFFTGTIHAVRIYGRKLTQAEILANQQNDAVYYGL